MPGLQRGVLAIVGKAQQLLCLGGHTVVTTQAEDGTGAENCRCGRAPGLTEGHQLAKVAGLSQVVSSAAARA